MPGWHKNVRDLVESGKLVLLGVTQEQHAERCQLFAKWQQFDWPILHDPINLLECRAVPITCAIDEAGIVQSTSPTPTWVRDKFVDNLESAQLPEPTTPKAPVVNSLRQQASEKQTADAYRLLGDAIMLWQPAASSAAVRAYQSSLKKKEDPQVRFRLGVALRQRYESRGGDPPQNDFKAAVDNWLLALKADPNQYIWRRRIQQYGPRLDKPYPFYDWVEQATSDLEARGEKVSLRVALSGAEIAKPAKRASVDLAGAAENPDPDGKITRDISPLIRIRSTVVPDSKSNAKAFRLHLTLSPTGEAVWNNEVEPISVWFNSHDVYAANKSLHRIATAVNTAESNETRSLEVEFARNSGKNPGETVAEGKGAAAQIRGYVLYHVCEKSSQQCIFRRQDFTIPIKIE